MDVAVLEARELLRQGLAAMLGRIPTVDRVECHPNLDELLRRKARDHQWNPHVVIVGGAPNEDVADRVRRCFPTSRILKLVASAEHNDLALAVATHADGYLMVNDATEATLGSTLHALMRGERTMPRPVADYLFECARSTELVPPRQQSQFTPSEQAVVDLLLEGFSNGQIAQRLGISLHSAKRRVSSVLQKASSPSRAHFVAQMLRDGR